MTTGINLIARTFLNARCQAPRKQVVLLGLKGIWDKVKLQKWKAI